MQADPAGLASPGQFRLQLFKSTLITINEGQVTTFIPKPHSQRTADPAGGTRNHRNLAIKLGQAFVH
jgi:hypothetical protein